MSRFRKSCLDAAAFIVEFQPNYVFPAAAAIKDVAPHGVYIIQLRYATKEETGHLAFDGDGRRPAIGPSEVPADRSFDHVWLAHEVGGIGHLGVHRSPFRSISPGATPGQWARLRSLTRCQAIRSRPCSASERPGTRRFVLPRNGTTGLTSLVHLQYVYFMRNLLHGDLGESITTRRPVMDDLRQFVPGTIELAISAMLFAIVIGVPLGILAAINQDRWPDHFARFIALIGTSIPVFWLGLLALYLFFYKLQWLPGPGRLDTGMPIPERITGMVTIDAALRGQWDIFRSSVKHLILPSIVLGSFALGIIARMLRRRFLRSRGRLCAHGAGQRPRRK